MAKTLIQIKDLEAWSDSRKVLDRVNMSVEDKKVLSIIGPRGSGKSTLLRCLNRLFDERVGNRVKGEIIYNEKNILGPHYNTLKLRRNFSMIFSEPTTFSHLSIFENISLGMRLNRIESGAHIGEAVEKALIKVGLWDELRLILHRSPQKLNPGQKQLICLARSICMKPKVLLMDEATTMVGLQVTLTMEQLMREFSEKFPIIFTTSSRKQAARISDRTAFLLDGELIEVGKTSDLFMNPKDTRTEDYITGRFG